MLSLDSSDFGNVVNILHDFLCGGEKLHWQ